MDAAYAGQPPSGGCELKQVVAFGFFGYGKPSRLRAAVS